MQIADELELLVAERDTLISNSPRYEQIGNEIQPLKEGPTTWKRYVQKDKSNLKLTQLQQQASRSQLQYRESLDSAAKRIRNERFQESVSRADPQFPQFCDKFPASYCK